MSSDKFLNRELSWIEFNARVLSEALNPANPLLERLKFLCIVSSNFDEFFMVRVASIKRQLRTGGSVRCPSGMSAESQLAEVSRRVKEITANKYRCLLTEIFPGLARAGIVYLRPDEFTRAQVAFTKTFFTEEVFPVLTPVRATPDRPIPYSGNVRLHIAFLLRPMSADAVDAAEQSAPVGVEVADDAQAEFVAVVQIPPSLDRVVFIPDTTHPAAFTLLEHIIVQNASALFPGFEVIESARFRITRDADLGVDEERDEDFVEAMEQVLEHREFSLPIRVSINRDAGRLATIITESLGLGPDDVYIKDEPLDLSCLMAIASMSGFDELRDERWTPIEPPTLADVPSLWDAMSKQDILLHHPYESFDPVVRLVQTAADDPKVLAIKMTLYRTGGRSAVVQALETAAQNKKQVAVLVELKARFDEEQNIAWAERLERAGAIVVYGIAQLKVHAKALMIVRRENDGVKRYLHLGTGNYNEKTARLYTDIGLLTTRADLAYELGLFFNAITGYSAIPTLSKLVMAPNTMKTRVIQLIEREKVRAESGSPAKIMAKMNSVADPDVINALYAAGQAGVTILLNIRGISMLRPGVKGLSENITVVSIIDRYLEHTRMVYVYNDGAEELYLTSADWMPRNLERRVELLFPIEDRKLLIRARGILETFFRDNVKAHRQNPDGSYTRLIPKNAEPLQAQRTFYQQLRASAADAAPVNQKEFTVRRKSPKGKG